MKTRISLIIILLLVYVCCSSLKAQNKSSYDDDGYLRIETEQDLKDFANIVNDGDAEINARLHADITLTDNTMIGCDFAGVLRPYKGSFDGNGHTITVNYNTSQQYTALFRYTAAGVSIENLRVAGTITTNAKYAAGIIALTFEELTGIPSSETTDLNRCTSSVTIISDVVGDGTHGGLVAESSNGTVNISNCIFDGSINGTNTTMCGGLVGYVNNAVNFSNCLQMGTFNISSDMSLSDSFVRTYENSDSGISLSNCCYLNALGYVRSGLVQVTNDQLASGEVTYLLQGEQETDVWGQNIDNGETVQPRSVIGGATVYKHSSNEYSNYPAGQCGNNLIWEINEDGILTISGTGSMYNYDNSENKSPWKAHTSLFQNVLIEEGVVSIGNHAFDGCNILTGTLTLPSSIKTIGSYAFSECRSLRGSLIIPIGVTSIGNNAFYKCSGMGGVLAIPGTVTDIGDKAFYDCSSITDVYSFSMPNLATLGSEVFTGLSYNAALHYPDADEQDYIEGGWLDYFSVRLPYEEYMPIDSEEDLILFASYVNDGYKDLKGILKANITLTDNTMIGTSANNYAGTFDGNGFAITVSYNTDEDYTALFRYVSGATINNLTVNGSITTSRKFAAGIIGYCTSAYGESVTLNKCTSSVAISTTFGGDGTHGGIVANNNATLNINDCIFDGSIMGGNTTMCGGIVGYSSSTVNFSNCLQMGTFSISIVSCDTFVRTNNNSDSGINLSNCYYLNQLDNVRIGLVQVTNEQLASGEVTYLLNGSTSDGEIAWGQNIDNGQIVEDHPVIDGATVYKKIVNDAAVYSNITNVIANGVCGDNLLWKIKEENEAKILIISGTGSMYDYDNEDNKAPWIEYSVNKLVIEKGLTSIGSYAFYGFEIGTALIIPNGVTSIGDCAFADLDLEKIYTFSKPAPALGENVFNTPNETELHYPVISEDSYIAEGWLGYFENSVSFDNFVDIDSKEKFKNFVEYVNEKGYTDVNAKLYVDITLDEGDNAMIGTADNQYSGTFDGNGHTITVNYNTDKEYAALFSYVNCATIENLTVAGTITTSAKFAGGFIGYNVSDVGYLNKCKSSVTINSTIDGDGSHGGFVGRAYGDLEFTDCIFDGCIIGENTTNCGGFVGYSYGIIFSNCLQMGTFQLKEITGCGTYSRGSHTIFNNSYYLNAFDETPEEVAQVTLEQISSGEVAYLLQGEQETHVWGQNIDNGQTVQTQPVIGGAKVYKNIVDGNVQFSNNEAVLYSGQCGDNVTWTLSSLGTLTISGTGAMWDYYYEVDYFGTGVEDDRSPWTEDDIAVQLKTLVIEEGITHIGDCAFSYCSGFTGTLTIPNSVETIGEAAFEFCTGFTGDLIIPKSVTLIEGDAFYYCSGISDVYALSTTAPVLGVYLLHSYAFARLAQPAVFHYPASAKQSYMDNLWFDDNDVMEEHEFFDICLGYDEDGYVVLESQTDISFFAKYLSNGYVETNGRMIADIEMPDNMTIGVPNFPYKGTFDGNGHTITVNYNTDEYYSALFPYVHNVTIRNLRVAGEINTSGYYAAGIIAYAFYGSITLDRCTSSVTINSSADDSYSIGGLIALNLSDLTISNSLFDGSINGGAENTRCGGFVGSSTKGIKFQDCLQIGSFDVVTDDVNKNTYVNGSFYTHEFTNCYYANDELVNTPDKVVYAAPEGLADGYICYMLDKGTSVDDVIWGQIVDLEGETPDDYPILGGKRVYSYQGSGVYSNYPNIVNKGQCGDDLYWRLDTEGELTIIGTGAMYDYDNEYNKAPWRHNLPLLMNIKFDERMTSIGDYAFYGCEDLNGSLQIPNAVTSVGDKAFNTCANLDELFFYRNENAAIGSDAFAGGTLAKVYAPAIWTSYENIPESQLVQMPTYTSIQVDELPGQQGWVFPEGQTELNENDNVAINVPLVLSQQSSDLSHTSTLTVKSFGYCGDGTNVNGSITVEDGGQLYCDVARGEVTVRRNIEGYAVTEPRDQYENKWYTIASPLKDVTSTASVAGMITTESDYDLYRYDEPTYTWENYKVDENNFNTLDVGRGYLYANAENTTLEFTGNINTEDVTYTLTTDGEMLTGFHLIGNPFTHDIKFNHFTAASLVNGYFVLNGDGAWGATLGNSPEDVIAVGQSALIKATDAGSLTICRQSVDTRQLHQNIKHDANYTSKQQILSLRVSNSIHSDKAFIVFDKGVGLNKINHQSENIPLIYIPQDGTNYAIAMIDVNVNEIPVNFETNVMGEYTISLRRQNCEFKELYLFDKETGDKVNILEDDYTFMAKSNDNPERFTLIIESVDGNEDENFAYVSGSDLIINAEGKVQIIDMMGRVICSSDVESDNNRINVNDFDRAAYIVRIIGEDDVKVQKIVL